MTNPASPIVDPSRELLIIREFRAPRELVLRMFSSPEFLTNWWGPLGFSITTERFDFRPGGDWKFIMHGPDGTDYPNYIRYQETGPDRLVLDHSGDGGQTFDFTIVAKLEEIEPGTTRVEWRNVFASAEIRQEKVDRFRADLGLASTLSRLESLLAGQQSEPRPS